MRLVWGRGAQLDLWAIIDHYRRIDPDLPGVLIDRIDAGTAALIDYPRLGPELPDSRFRVWHARNAPFVLIYRVTGTEIRIVKVRHARSDWKP